MKRILLLCLLACFSYGCEKKDIPVPDNSLKGLFCSWNLVKMWGGFGGGMQTPLTMGYQQTVRFDRDGRCYTYKDGSRVARDNFELEYQGEGASAPYDMALCHSI